MITLSNDFKGSKWLATEPPEHSLESFVGSELFEDTDLVYQGQSAWEPLEAKYGQELNENIRRHTKQVRERFEDYAKKLAKVVDSNFRSNDDRETLINMPSERKYDHYFEHILPNLIKGRMDRITYEESCMLLFGPQAYVLFTFDHLIVNFIRVVSDMYSLRNREEE